MVVMCNINIQRETGMNEVIERALTERLTNLERTLGQYEAIIEELAKDAKPETLAKVGLRKHGDEPLKPKEPKKNKKSK